MNVAQQIAVILRAPPGIGKSRIADLICDRCPQAEQISLDKAWGDRFFRAPDGRPIRLDPDQYRSHGGPGRYADLAAAKKPILLVELGWGEPAELHCNGATRGADEWVTVLENSGRKIYPFLLWADRATAYARLQDRQQRKSRHWREAFEGMGTHAMYEFGHPFYTLPTITNFHVRTIDTTGRTHEVVAEEILLACGVI